MTEIQGKSILVRVSEGWSYWESTVLLPFFLLFVHLSHNISEGSQRPTLLAPGALPAMRVNVPLSTPMDSDYLDPLYVSGKLPTYPSLKPTFCPK